MENNKVPDSFQKQFMIQIGKLMLIVYLKCLMTVEQAHRATFMGAPPLQSHGAVHLEGSHACFIVLLLLS